MISAVHENGSAVLQGMFHLVTCQADHFELPSVGTHFLKEAANEKVSVFLYGRNHRVLGHGRFGRGSYGRLEWNFQRS